MEYRAWVTVPELPLSAQEQWEPLMHYMETVQADFGPIISWASGDAANLVLFTDAPDESTAAQMMYDAVVDGLRASGLANRYPVRVEVEADASASARTASA